MAMERYSRKMQQPSKKNPEQDQSVNNPQNSGQDPTWERLWELMVLFLSFHFYVACSPRAHGLWVGVPTVKRENIMHPTNIFIEIKANRSSKVIHLGASFVARARMRHGGNRLRFRA